VLALVVGELLARVLRPIPYSTSEVWSGFDEQLRAGMFVADPVVGYVPGPAWAPAGRHGFRNGAEYDGSSEPATDVVLLGDSLLQEGELGKAMQTRLAGKPARVWVAGIGGYNTLQEAYYLEHRITLDPDVLVLGFCLNDFSRSMIVVGSADDGKFVAPDFEPLAAVNPFLFRTSALYRLGQAALMARLVERQFSPEGVRANRENVRRGLERMQRYAEARGAAFLVILYPHLVERELPWQHEAHLQAQAIFAELHLRYVDVSDDYAARGLLALRRKDDDPVHPSAEGHDIAARRLLQDFPEVFPP
jgi:lysophospholipase L1-like esterase